MSENQSESASNESYGGSYNTGETTSNSGYKLTNTSTPSGYQSGVGSSVGSVAGGVVGGALLGPVGSMLGRWAGNYFGGGGTLGDGTGGSGLPDNTKGGSMSSNYFDGNLSSLINIGAGISALGGGNSMSGSDVTKAADPMAPYRPGLAKTYNDALTAGNKTDITQMPGYSQFQSGVMDPALEASKRSAAASGMLQSGGEQVALQKTAQQGYYGFMTDYLNRLATGAGANSNPSTAVGMGTAQTNANQAGTMQGIGAIAQGVSGLGKYFNGSGYAFDGGTGGSTGTMGGNWLDQAQFVGDASTQMPSLNPSNIDPLLEWSM